MLPKKYRALVFLELHEKMVTLAQNEFLIWHGNDSTGQA